MLGGASEILDIVGDERPRILNGKQKVPLIGPRTQPNIAGGLNIVTQRCQDRTDSKRILIDIKTWHKA